MIRHRMVPNGALLAAERDDFNYWDPEAAALVHRIATGPHATLPFSEIAQIHSGLTPAKDEYSYERGPSDGVILKVANLSNAGIVWDGERLSYVSSDFFKRATRAHVQRYDLLMLSAAHQRRYIGKRVDIVDHIPSGVEGNVMAVAEILIVRPNLELVNPFYLLAVLRTPTVQSLITHLVRGQTGHLYPDDIGSLRLPIPKSTDFQKSLAAQVVGADGFACRARAEMEALQAATSAHVDAALYSGTDGTAAQDLIVEQALKVRQSTAVEFHRLRDSVALDPETDFIRVSTRLGRRRGATVVD